MSTDQKIVVFGISAMLFAILSTIAYNAHDSELRVEAYRECLATNEKIVMSGKIDRYSTLPTCYMR